MLLNLKNRFDRARSDRGSALVAVIGVLLVSLVVTTVISASVIHALSYSTMTRASIQSQAAAEAGLAVAQASLIRGECTTGIYQSTTDPVYYVEVTYVNAGVQYTGCPAETSSEVRILATGNAATPGVSFTAGDEAKVQALYISSGSGVPASGAAIYAYSAAGFGNAGSLVSLDGSEATVHIKDGDVYCSNTADLPDGFVVANGSLYISNKCDIGGSVWVSDDLVISNSIVVGGNAVAGNLQMSNSSRINGTAWIHGHTRLTNSSRVNGMLTTKTIDASASATPGGLTLIPSGPPVQPIPTVAEWIDYQYDASEWTAFTERVISGSCSFSDIQSAINGVNGAPVLLDARSCSNGIRLSNTDVLQLNNNVAIFSNQFVFSNSSRIQSATDRTLWLITPDTVVNGQPDCPPGGFFSVNNSFTIGNKIDALVYTPCRVDMNNSIDWYGQIFAGETGLSNTVTVYFQPVGLPGVDLSTGLPLPNQPLSELLLNPTVTRNVGG